MDWYNGYSPQEREAMDRAPYPEKARKPPCALCGDPQPKKMQTHAEDYSQPYIWEPPAAYPVCVTCHSRIHSRFDAPDRWHSFLAFLRKGFYAREISSEQLHEHHRSGAAYTWPLLSHPQPKREGKGAWWWEALTLDPDSRRSPSARPRP